MFVLDEAPVCEPADLVYVWALDFSKEEEWGGYLGLPGTRQHCSRLPA